MVGSQQLEAALQTLYHHSDPSTKEQANRWLEAWQQSTEAWQGCHDVLQSATAGLEAQYFAASTLRNKIQREYEDLPPGTAMNLAESLMSLLVRHAQGRHAVRTQLCIALASLAIHVPAAQWGPGGPLAWWASHLSQGQAQSVALPCMLELLTVFPQEAAIHQPAVTPARRRELRQEIETAIPEAFSLLIHCMRQTAAGERVQVLESFAAWLKLVGSDGFNAESVQACLPLVNAALEGLSGDGDGFYAATDAVIELIYCTSHHGRPRDEMAAIVQVLVPQVMALRPRFHMCAQQAAAERAEAGAVSDEHHHGGHGDPEEDAKAIARLFAEVGEAYTDLIASGAAEVMPPVEALLDVASHPDNDICAISFNFWHRLSRGLTVGLRPQPLFAEDEEPALSKEESSRRIAIFAPHLERLVVLLRTRVRFPDDFDTWHRDERLDFKHARLAVGDTLLDVAAVLGGETIMRLLVEPLLELSTMVAQGNKFDWRAAEAALYCIRCVYRAAPFAGEPVLLSLFAALPSLPAPPQLQYTAALTVGAYADWLAETARASEQGKQVLNALLDMLIAGLSESDSAAACALSLRRVCHGCATLLSPGIPSLLELYRRVQPCGDIASEEESALDLDEEDVGHVVEAVGLVASSLPDGERQACVQRMLDVVVQPMQAILNPWAVTQGVAPTAEDRARLPLVLPLAERVTTIFKVVADPADVGEALVRLWPWLEAALEAFGADAAAAEKICRVPRYALRNAGKAAVKAVPALASALPRRFEMYRHSSYLFVASEMIKAFGDTTETDAVLGPMLSRMLMTACSLLTNLMEVGARPDVADDTFLLAGRALNYAPRLVVTPELLPPLLFSVRAGILVQHSEACHSIVSFVVRLLDPATHRKCPPETFGHLQQALGSHAPTIIRLAMAGALGQLPRARLQEMADVVHAMLKVAGSNALGWLVEALAPVPPEGIPAADRERFLGACQSVASSGFGVGDETALFEALLDLSETCRRSRKSQAATEAALLPQVV